MLRTRVDVLVIGGGTGGAIAAIAAARLGASVLVIEETPWLGGMLTAAGVSALDGNKGELCGGILRELREHVEQHYGGAAKLRTGWISETSFEPDVAARFLADQARQSRVEVWHEAELLAVRVTGRRVRGAVVRHLGSAHEVEARITIEATEWGDVLALASVDHSLGREGYDETGEDHAPRQPDDEIQDLTYCAILKRFDGRAPEVAEVPEFAAADFDGTLAEHASHADEAIWNHRLHDFKSFLSYSRLPNDRYLLNWPFHANDHPVRREMFLDRAVRRSELAVARRRTLAYVRFMQRELEHPEWGIDPELYATPDRLPYLPYVRESRRVNGMRKMLERDVLPSDGAVRAPFCADAIAVGDYYLDHHHSKAHLPPDRRLIEDYPSNGPFQVPYGALVPLTMDGLLVAEKSFSVSHIVNGCSRLQPVVAAVGQAAGVAAALCVRGDCEPREISVETLQRTLLEQACVLYPYRDIGCRHPAFERIQRVALLGGIDELEPMTFEVDRGFDRARAERLALALARLSGDDASSFLARYREGMRASEFVATP